MKKELSSLEIAKRLIEIGGGTPPLVNDLPDFFKDIFYDNNQQNPVDGIYQGDSERGGKRSSED